VQKRYVVTLAAKNLGLLMRVLFGIGSPRSLQGLASLALAIVYLAQQALRRLHCILNRLAHDRLATVHAVAMDRFLIQPASESMPDDGMDSFLHGAAYAPWEEKSWLRLSRLMWRSRSSKWRYPNERAEYESIIDSRGHSFRVSCRSSAPPRF